MAKVLFVGRWFPPRVGGMENYLFELYRRLPPGSVDLLLPDEPGARAFDRRHSLPVQRVYLPPGLSIDRKRALAPLLVVAFGRLLRGGYTQVHCGHVLTGAVGWLAWRLWGLPYVVYAFGAEISGGSLGALKRLVLRHARIVITISRYTTAQVQAAGVAPERIRVIAPGVDLTRYHPDGEGESLRARLGLTGRPLLLTVGRLDRSSQYKGHDTVIAALPAIRREVPDVAYLIVGSGNDQPRLTALAEAAGVRDAVIFTGYVPYDALPSYFAACDLFVLPNRVEPFGSGEATEGFGMVSIEAAASARPVIAGRHGGSTDAVADGETGLLLDPPDAAGVATAVLA
ncbi:MAG: glycosyltransferase, partial [Chloroflexota bacterium]|nr:glycosyltransferase [Chloroflexota bacterium]